MSESSNNDSLMKEWDETRNVIKTFDDRIHDLRKYGFTFVTGILTIQGIFLPYIPAHDSQGASGIPDGAKLGVLVATILLIVVLRWLDGNYQGFQYGASTRAKVIERFLNLELTDSIALRYEVEKLWLPKIVLYLGFEGATIGLAFAFLSNHVDWVLYLILGVVVETILYYRFASPDRRRGNYRASDWALDRLQCMKNEQIRIMLTNLDKETYELKKGEAVWKIVDDNNKEKHKEIILEDVKILHKSSYVWSLKLDFTPGIYRVIVNLGREHEERELSRKLFVTQ